MSQFKRKPDFQYPRLDILYIPICLNLNPKTVNDRIDYGHLYIPICLNLNSVALDKFIGGTSLYIPICLNLNADWHSGF